MTSSLHAHSQVDMPCGSMSWVSDFLADVWEYQPRFRYVGMDVTPSVVAFNQKFYEVRVRVVSRERACAWLCAVVPQTLHRGAHAEERGPGSHAVGRVMWLPVDTMPCRTTPGSRSCAVISVSPSG